MNLLGLKVKHKAFGLGEIVEIKDNYITVVFENKTTKFVYPNAFETFIQAVDDEIQNIIASEIKEAKKIDEARIRNFLQRKEFREVISPQTETVSFKLRPV